MKRITIVPPALAIAVLLLAGCSKKEEADGAKEPQAVAPVQVAVAERGPIQRVVEADAVLWAVNQATVMPKINAPVAKFYANRGDHVKAGQLLAVLENRDLVAAADATKAQLAQAEANLRSTTGVTVPEGMVKARSDAQAAREQLDAAQKLLESRQNLYKEGALARRLVDEAQVQYASAKAALESAQEHLRAQQTVGNQESVRTARAQVDAARAQAQAAEAQVSYSEVRSPITGIVAERPLFPGDMASTGQPLYVIMDVSRIVARANVPQAEASQVHVGDPATIKSAAVETEVPGKVTVISPAADTASTTVQVWVEAPNPNDRLKPGESAHVAIVAGTVPNATLVPAAALVSGEGGGNSVVVVTPANTAQVRQVEVGVREGDKVQIVSGVAPGDKVVTVGAVGLEDKAKVRIVQAETASGEEKK